MIQQYVLLRKENDLLNSLVGNSFNNQSKFEAEKILDEIHSKAESRMLGKKALCYIVDNNEIKGVGGSTMMKDKTGKISSNLILDNFGLFLAAIFMGIPASGAETIVLKDTGGVNRTVNIISLVPLWNFSTGATMFHQVGSGSLAPARTDFNINTAFGTAPEDAIFEPSDPVYNSSIGNFKSLGSITAGGSGTINESIIVSRWRDSGNTNRFFAHFRDIISPGQSFIAGQAIALEYTVQL